MAASVFATSTTSVDVVLIVDRDDPEYDTYVGLALLPNTSLRTMPERVGYVRSLNAVAKELWDTYTILGAFGDDVVFSTQAWDELIEDTLGTPGIAYGDDRIHGERHPSAVFMSSVIAKALGWLALPATSHQWADDGWKRLGQETGLLRYVPEVVVEHFHPGVGKAEWDDTYRAVFDADRAKADHDGFQAWLEDGLAADAAKVRGAVRA